MSTVIVHFELKRLLHLNALTFNGLHLRSDSVSATFNMNLNAKRMITMTDAIPYHFQVFFSESTMASICKKLIQIDPKPTPQLSQETKDSRKGPYILMPLPAMLIIVKLSDQSDGHLPREYLVPPTSCAPPARETIKNKNNC